MKYKIITDEIVKGIIEFLDDIQFAAAGSDNPEDITIVNVVSYFIGELLNSPDVFDNENKSEKHIEDENIFWEFDDLTEDEFNSLIENFDNFYKGWSKSYDKDKIRKKNKTLKGLSKNLKKTRKLTLEEKFEIYYNEYKKKKDKPISFDNILKRAGLRKSNGGSDTH